MPPFPLLTRYPRKVDLSRGYVKMALLLPGNPAKHSFVNVLCDSSWIVDDLLSAALKESQHLLREEDDVVVYSDEQRSSELLSVADAIEANKTLCVIVIRHPIARL